MEDQFFLQIVKRTFFIKIDLCFLFGCLVGFKPFSFETDSFDSGEFIAFETNHLSPILKMLMQLIRAKT